MREIDNSTKTQDAVVETSVMPVSDTLSGSETSRRRWVRAGLSAAPVLVTLASRPVLAGQCLSNMMSGNLSDPNRGQCATGWSPGGWGNPGGTIHIYTTSGAWNAVGLQYGTLIAGHNPAQFSSYSAGSTLANVPSVLNKDAVSTTRELRGLLVRNPSQYQLTRHLVCAYLNALLGALPSSTFLYILKPQQVLDLADGSMALPPGYSDLQAFLGSTWA